MSGCARASARPGKRRSDVAECVVQPVGPGLHHACALRQQLGPVVGGDDLAGRGVGELEVNQVARYVQTLTQGCHGERPEPVARHAPPVAHAVDGRQQGVVAQRHAFAESAREDQIAAGDPAQNAQNGYGLPGQRNDVVAAHLHAGGGDRPAGGVEGIRKVIPFPHVSLRARRAHLDLPHELPHETPPIESHCSTRRFDLYKLAVWVAALLLCVAFWAVLLGLAFGVARMTLVSG